VWTRVYVHLPSDRSWNGLFTRGQAEVPVDTALRRQADGYAPL
jgi:hypothetical protein